MKVTLTIEVSNKDIKEEWIEEGEMKKEDVEANLIDMLFEVCEDWVLHGQQPDLEITEHLT